MLFSGIVVRSPPNPSSLITCGKNLFCYSSYYWGDIFTSTFYRHAHRCEWLMLNDKWAICSYIVYHGENKSDFGEMMMSGLYLTCLAGFFCIVLAHWNNKPQVDMWLHLDTLSWFRPSQSFFLLLNATCLTKRSKYQIYSHWFDPTRLEHTIRHSQGEQANLYTARAVSHEHNWFIVQFTLYCQL